MRRTARSLLTRVIREFQIRSVEERGKKNPTGWKEKRKEMGGGCKNFRFLRNLSRYAVAKGRRRGGEGIYVNFTFRCTGSQRESSSGAR